MRIKIAIMACFMLCVGVIIGFKTIKTKITIVDMRTQEISKLNVSRTATIILRRGGGWDISTK
jgi:hypothetical protein